MNYTNLHVYYPNIHFWFCVLDIMQAVGVIVIYCYVHINEKNATLCFILSKFSVIQLALIQGLPHVLFFGSRSVYNTIVADFEE